MSNQSINNIRKNDTRPPILSRPKECHKYRRVGMNEPTFKQAIHLLKLVDDSGIILNQLQDVYNSGFLSILLNANLSEIDKVDFMKVCGLVVVPASGSVFDLTVAGKTKKFQLIDLPAFEDLNEAKEKINQSVSNKTTTPVWLDAFRKKYPICDGELVFLAYPEHHGCPFLYGYKGESWHKGSHDSERIYGIRWLVEVVDEKAEQPKITILDKDGKLIKEIVPIQQTCYMNKPISD